MGGEEDNQRLDQFWGGGGPVAVAESPGRASRPQPGSEKTFSDHEVPVSTLANLHANYSDDRHQMRVGQQCGATTLARANRPAAPRRAQPESSPRELQAAPSAVTRCEHGRLNDGEAKVGSTSARKGGEQDSPSLESRPGGSQAQIDRERR